MSTENIKLLIEKVSQDPSLQAKVTEIFQNAPADVAEKLSKMSEELGVPATVEEILAATRSSSSSLSESELEKISGGVEFSWETFKKSLESFFEGEHSYR